MSYFDDELSLTSCQEKASNAEFVSEDNNTNRFSSILFEENIKLGEEIGSQKGI